MGYLIAKQNKPAAATPVDLYACPNNMEFVASTLIVCNQAGADSFRIVVSPTGLLTTAEMYIAYDTAISANNFAEVTVGMTLVAGSIIQVYSTLGNCSFSLFGKEIQI